VRRDLLRALRVIGAGWRRASFSTKFALVILIAGAVMSLVPFWLAQSNTRTQAVDRATDKAGVAANLIQQQRQALTAFASAIARQVGTTPPADTAAVEAALRQDVAVNQSGDVIGVAVPDVQEFAIRGASVLPSGDPLTVRIVNAVASGQTTIADATGAPWLLAYAPLGSGGGSAFVARPVTSQFITAIARNIETSADPADLAVVSSGHFAVGSSFAGLTVSNGTRGDPALLQVVSSGSAEVLTVNSSDVAVSAQPLGGGFQLVVSTPVNAVATSIQPIMLLVTLILVSMLFIVILVQTELQQPLRRLDRAVAALGRGEFDVPVSTGTDDELSRLGATFEAMRVQLQSTMRAAAARAQVATELAASQPLETSLSRVLHELRSSLKTDAALIVVSGSEMADPFAIVEGTHDIEIDEFLSGDGPLGEGYRYAGQGALVVCAAPSSREAQLGLHEFCVAPLRLGNHVHGVLAVANQRSGFLASDVELVSSSAEQIALALERYRFLAVVQRQASIDDLTGLYNHRFLVDYLGQQVALAERLNAPLAILMLDIDHFKSLNDTHGHQAGDTALAAFAQTLVNSVRGSDLAARYGGEEFAVVMYNTTADEARLVAEKIRTAVTQATIELPDQQRLSLSVSIGGAAFPEDTDSAKELLALADEALYKAKRSGRDRTCMSSETSRRTRHHAVVSVVHTDDSVEPGSNVGVGAPHRSA